MTGRKTKLYEAWNPLITEIKKGNTQRNASTIAGINEKTLYYWLQRGRKGDFGYNNFYKEFKEAKKNIHHIKIDKGKYQLPTFNNKDNSTNTYFITDGEFVKIGITKNPKLRLAYIQSHYPKIVEIIAIFPYNVEKILHNKFKHLRVNGEWFKLNKEIADYLNITLITS